MEKHKFNRGENQYPKSLAVLFDNIIGDDTPAATVSGEKALEIVSGENALEIGMKVAFDLGKSLGPDATTEGIKTAWDKYAELETTLGGLPSTWYPALIRAMVKAAYSRPVFVPGGASRMVSNVERRLGHVAPPIGPGEGPMTVIQIKGGSEAHEYPVHRDVRALIDGLTESLRVLRETLNRERADRRGLDGGENTAAETAVLDRPSQALAENSEQPMDATNMIVLGMLGIERVIGGLASQQPEEVGPVLEQASEVAREIRLALTGEDTAAGVMVKLAGAMKAIIDAEQELADVVTRQWNGKDPLKMSIPARPAHDSDLIIADAMAKARALLFPGVGLLRMAPIRPAAGG